MEKDFDEWNISKKVINERKSVFSKPREIWWCSLGINIGREQNGQNALFARPILIFKVFNNDTFLGLPITSKKHEGDFYFSFNLGGDNQYIPLSQIRILSTKRLQRKISTIPSHIFNILKYKLHESIFSNEIPLAGEISEAGAIVADR